MSLGTRTVSKEMLETYGKVVDSYIFREDVKAFLECCRKIAINDDILFENSTILQPSAVERLTGFRASSQEYDDFVFYVNWYQEHIHGRFSDTFSGERRDFYPVFEASKAGVKLQAKNTTEGERSEIFELYRLKLADIRSERERREAVLERQKLQPVAEIPAETTNEKYIENVGDVSKTWEVLTYDLPLNGPEEMTDLRHTGGLGGFSELRAKAPWMEEVIARVEEQVEFMKVLNRPWVTFDPILIAGPSGAGKTYFARLLAKSLKVSFVAQCLSGVSDNRLIEGTSRGWSNMTPSWPARALASTRTANPILFLDELDKVSGDTRNGDPIESILPMIDRENSRAYYDRCLTAEVNMSQASWIFAANETQGLGTAFLDRVEVIKVQEPTLDYLPIILDSMVADFASRLGVDRDIFEEISDLDVKRFERDLGRGRSMRAVGREFQRHLMRSVKAGMIARPAALASQSEDDDMKRFMLEEMDGLQF